MLYQDHEDILPNLLVVYGRSWTVWTQSQELLVYKRLEVIFLKSHLYIFLVSSTTSSNEETFLQDSNIQLHNSVLSVSKDWESMIIIYNYYDCRSVSIYLFRMFAKVIFSSHVTNCAQKCGSKVNSIYNINRQEYQDTYRRSSSYKGT